MSLVCPDVQKGRTRIIIEMGEVQGYLDSVPVGDFFGSLAFRTGFS